MNNKDKSLEAAGHHGDQVTPAADDEHRQSNKDHVRTEDYGMQYNPRNYVIVQRARKMPDDRWNELPIEILPPGTVLHANEEMLKKESIDKVTSGAEPIRVGYVTKLWRDERGDLHIVDGHHRVAMYYVLGREIPVRISDSAIYDRLMNLGG